VDGLSLAEAEIGQLEAALKKRISFLLKAHHGLSDLRATTDAARITCGRCMGEYKQACALPFSTSADQLSLFFTQSEERYTAACAAQDAFDRAQSDEAKASVSMGLLASELTQLTQTIKAARQDLAASPVLSAASLFASQATTASKKRFAGKDEKDMTAAELTAEDQALIASLARAKMRVALAVGKSKPLVASLKALAEPMKAAADCDDVTEPVRPTEEEVQRYLTTLEVTMRERQKTHRRAKELFSEQNSTLHELNEANAALTRELEALGQRVAPKPHQLSSAVVTAEVVQAAYTDVYSKLYWADRTSDEAKAGHDTFERTAPTAKETKQIEVLRKGMRDLGYSLGRRNEAVAARRSTQRITEVEASRRGIGASNDLKQSLDWLSKNDLLQEDARQQNLSRSTKLELLEESVEAFKKEIKSVSQTLHQVVVSLLPKQSEPPCDELRALLNAAAWMCSDLKEEEGAFPIY